MTVSVNGAWFVAELREMGGVHMLTANLPTDVAEFRRELRRAAKGEGMRLQNSNRDDYFIASDPDHVVYAERLRDAADAARITTDPDCPQCGTRCMPRGVAWRCRSCDLVVLS